MREVKVLDWCDGCWADGERRTPAVVTFTVGITESESRPTLHTVSGCEDHAKALRDLAELIAEHGAPVEPAVAEPRPSYNSMTAPSYGARDTCPVCHREMVRSGVVKHIYAVHLRMPNPARPTVCPDCGLTVRNAEFAAAGIGRHRTASHGYDPVAEAMALYNRMRR